MKRKPYSRRKRTTTKSVLRLPDLEHAKAAVLNSLTSLDAQRGYRHAIDEFVDWYCSEPRLAFNRIVVLRYRSHLESRQLAPGTVNLRLGAMRRLAYEAADCGLLSADLAAGIRRVKGVKKLGVRLGNWLTAEQGQALWQAPDPQRLKGKRDRALLALLLACGLRRHEAVALRLDHLQQREEHWAIVDLVGKGGHVRTVPVPDWVRTELDDWLAAAAIDRGKLFRWAVAPAASNTLLPTGITFAKPKSRILACPRLVTKMFADLMSRWMMPSACAASSASAISIASPRSTSVSMGLPSMRCLSVMPSRNSMTMKGWPFSCPIS